MFWQLQFCLLILVMLDLLTLQNPLPVLNSDATQITSHDSQSSKLNVPEHIRDKTNFKRQVRDETENYHPPYISGHTIKHNIDDTERSKRLDGEDGGAIDKTPYYKPISEEAKETHPLGGSKQEIREKADGKIESYFSAPSKTPVTRPQREAIAANGKTQEDSAKEKNRISNYLKSESYDMKNMDSSKSLRRIERNSGHYYPVESSLLSSEALDTIKKINPFTIGDQVAQMIHKRKCNFKSNKKCKSTFSSCAGALQDEDRVALRQDSNEGLKQTQAYNKQQLDYNKYNPEKQPLAYENPNSAYNKQLLADDKKSPVFYKRQPAYDSQRKISDKQLPAFDKQLPVIDRKQPAHDKQYPPYVITNPGYGKQKVEYDKHKPAYDKQQQFYDKQLPPKIVHKPNPSNDYGFSVIITAGDSQKSDVNTASKGSGMEENNFDGKEKYKHANKLNKNSHKDRGAIDIANEDSKGDSQKHNYQNPNIGEKQELRIEKSPNTHVEFPVYDQDLIFEPDPFNGLLDHSYSHEPENEDLGSGFTVESEAIPYHRIQARGLLKNKDNVKRRKDSSNSGNRNVTPTNMKSSDTDKTQALKSTGGTETQDSSTPSENSDNASEDPMLENSSGGLVEENTPEIEPFADRKIDMKKTCCISYKEPGSSMNTTVLLKPVVTR